MCRLQSGRTHRLYLAADGQTGAGLQADVPRRGRAAVPGANENPPSLDPPTVREGKVQAVRQGAFEIDLFSLCDIQMCFFFVGFVVSQIKNRVLNHFLKLLLCIWSIGSSEYLPIIKYRYGELFFD
jgi:hypothetical protein